jgi:hypothetical protein
MWCVINVGAADAAAADALHPNNTHNVCISCFARFMLGLEDAAMRETARDKRPMILRDNVDKSLKTIQQVRLHAHGTDL